MSSDNLQLNNAGAFLLARHLQEGRGDKTAVLTADRSVTYAELASGAAAAAAHLCSLGVQPEQRVALLLRDGPEFIFWFMGALKIGAVAVPLNTFCDSELLAYYLNDSRAPVLVTHRDYAEKVEPAEIRSTYLRHTVWVEEFHPQDVDDLVGYFPVSGDDSAMWLYTSGSTGAPKGAVHRHASFSHCAGSYARNVLNISESDVCYSTSKLFFAYGLGNSITFPFSVGGCCVLNEGKNDADSIASLLAQHKPSLFFSVPALYNLMLQHARVDDVLFSTVRMCISAGEYLPETVFEAWENRTKQRIYDGIGSTEAMHIFCSNRPDAYHAGSSGKPVDGYELKIVDDEGRDIAPGEIGNLMVRGQTAAKEYWNKYDASCQTFRGEWLYTGDLYRQNAGGYYVYAGRQGDAFKSSGLWVSPVEIEKALLSHDDVIEAAVVAGADEKGLAAPKAFVVRKNANGSDVEDFKCSLLDYLSERLSKYKVPHSVEVMESLPKTATGKVARAELRQVGGRAA